MTVATLIFVSDRLAFSNIQRELVTYRLVDVALFDGYMDLLIDTVAALVVIDAEHAQWRNFTYAARSSAATRRIPLLAISDDDQLRADATEAGADLALDWNTFADNATNFITRLARIPDQHTLEQLSCECGMDLPSLGQEGVAQFNKKNFYQQHDLFEALWVETDGPVRDLYRAVLQIGVAYYQIERGNFRGALKMLQRSVQWLHYLPDSCQGIDVAQLRRDSYAVRAELERLGPQNLKALDNRLLTRVRWTPPGTDDPPA